AGVNGFWRARGDGADLARAIGALYAPGALERLRTGVLPPAPGPLWDDYLAALGEAISAGQSRAGAGRLRRVSPAAAPSGRPSLSAGAGPRRGRRAGPPPGRPRRPPRGRGGRRRPRRPPAPPPPPPPRPRPPPP